MNFFISEGGSTDLYIKIPINLKIIVTLFSTSTVIKCGESEQRFLTALYLPYRETKKEKENSFLFNLIILFSSADDATTIQIQKI